VMNNVFRLLKSSILICTNLGIYAHEGEAYFVLSVNA
jgi:hypothetical protein